MSDGHRLDATHSAGDAVDDASEDARPLETVAPFSATRLRWQLALDLASRVGIAVAVVVMLVSVADWAGGSTLAIMLAVALAIGAWMLINGISARTSSQLSRVTAMIDDYPDHAEDQLAWHLRRKPLLKWVRLLLYHRVAMLRHRQKRHAEAATICHHVLGYRLGPAEAARHHLLLLLAEAQIDRADARGAYPAIAALHQASLPLIESMQRLALQTRYELLAGHPQRALWQHGHKLRLAELMPAEHNGAVHAMLATAADRTNERELGQWLWQRVELLASDEQRDRFKQGQFSLNVVSAPQDITTEA